MAKKRTAEERSPIEVKGNKNRQKKRCPVLQGLASQSTLEKFKFRHRGTVENKNVSTLYHPENVPLMETKSDFAGDEIRSKITVLAAGINPFLRQ